MQRIFLAALLVLAAAACAGAGAQQDLRATLVQLELERQAAYVAGDRAVLERHFAEEYVHTNLRGGQTDRAGELAFYRPGVFSLRAGRFEDAIVHRYGDTATLTGTVVWEDAIYRAGANTVDLSGRYSVSRVYVFRDDRWQLALSHASQVPPPRAANSGAQ